MRILFNAAGYKPAWNIGGPVQTLSAAAERLARRGHDVYVAATNSNLTESLDVDTEVWHEVDGVKVRYFPLGDSWSKKIPHSYFRKSMADYRAHGLEQWLASEAPDFDIIHSQLPFIHSSRICSRFAAESRISYFYSQHGVFDPVKLKYRALKKKAYLQLFELPVCRRADVLVALTEHERETYEALGLSNRIEVIPNGVELPESCEHEWPFPDFVPEGPLALFIGRLHPMKGADLAVEAFVKANVRGAKFIAAGPDEHGLEARLRDMAAEAGMQDSIQFPGPVSGEIKAALLARANVFILPTLTEGFSISILEALAHGCAVLTTPGSYFPELEEAGVGWLCERETSALAAKLSMLLSNDSLAADMGSRGKLLAERDFSWDSVVDKLESLYLELAQARKAA